MTARTTQRDPLDASTWTEQEQADLVTAMQNIADGINAATASLGAAFVSLTNAINAVEAAQLDAATTEGTAP